MDKVYLIVKEEDFFYDDKYIDIDVFKTKDDAEEFLKDYFDILLYDLENDYNGSKREDDLTFEEAIEITKEKNYVRIYLEDAYYITIEIQEKEVMKMGGN